MQLEKELKTNIVIVKANSYLYTTFLEVCLQLSRVPFYEVIKHEREWRGSQKSIYLVNQLDQVSLLCKIYINYIDSPISQLSMLPIILKQLLSALLNTY